jgi:hypothetical protein
MEITYIPMACGFAYLAAVVDWFSRRVLAWRGSINVEVDFCLEAVEEALALHAKPEIFNAAGQQDRGQHGRSRRVARQHVCRAAVVVGELRGVYLRAYDTVADAGRLISQYPDLFNRQRPPWRADAGPVTLPGCLQWRQRHEFRRGRRVVSPVGLRPSFATIRRLHVTQPTGKDPLNGGEAL